jgi:hypothetical protein
VLPPSFKGEVIDLPGANHLLKREPRPRKELSSASGASAYGDDTSMADLAPLAAWLSTLPGTLPPAASSLQRLKEAP